MPVEVNRSNTPTGRCARGATAGRRHHGLSGTSKSCTAPGRLGTDHRSGWCSPCRKAAESAAFGRQMMGEARAGCRRRPVRRGRRCVAKPSNARSLDKAAHAGLVVARARRPRHCWKPGVARHAAGARTARPAHRASACGWASTTSIPSSELLVRSRLWRTSRLTSPTTIARVQEHVERARDHAFGEFSTPTTPYWKAFTGKGMKNFIEVSGTHQACGAAKELDGRLFAERAFRAQHGHALRRFKRQAGGHDFALMAATWAPESGLGWRSDLRLPAPRDRGGRRVCLHVS